MAATFAEPLLRGNGLPSSSSLHRLAEDQTWEAPLVDGDPLAALGADAKTPQERRASMNEIRERYLHHLSQYRLAAAGYVPNLIPILRWGSQSALSSLLPSRSSSPKSHVVGGVPSPTRISERLLAARDTSPSSSTQDPRTGARECGSESGHRRMLRPGSVRSSVINVSAAALGAGALALPKAMCYAGILWGPLFMLILAGLSILSIRVIVQLVEVSQKDSYEEIAKVAFGPWFALLVEVNIILFCFGTAVAYMITVGQISHQILDAILGEIGPVHGVTPTSVLVAATVFILLPLSVLDSINDLRFASLAGVGCILYLIGVVVYVFWANSVDASLMVPREGFDGWQPQNGFQGCFKMLSLGIFAFCCQPNVPSIYTELEGKSFRRMEKVSIRSMGLCLFVYLLMGVFGFLSFGENTAGNVLQNLQPQLCDNDPVVISGFVCMAFAVTMAFPLNIFPIRFAIETALFYHRPHMNNRLVRYSIAFCAVALSLLVAVLVPEINLIFELIGATTGSFVCFIGPGILYCRLGPGHLMAPMKLSAMLLVVIGIVFLALGTYSSIQDVVEQLSATDTSAFVGCSSRRATHPIIRP